MLRPDTDGRGRWRGGGGGGGLGIRKSEVMRDAEKMKVFRGVGFIRGLVFFSQDEVRNCDLHCGNSIVNQGTRYSFNPRRKLNEFRENS